MQMEYNERINNLIREIEEKFSGKSLDDNKEELTKYSKEELKEIIRNLYFSKYSSQSLMSSSITACPGAPFVRRFSTQVLRLIAS